MKNILLISMMVITLVSCGRFKDNGELVGARSEEEWFTETPYGMVLIPGGSFTMGKTEENRWGGFENPPKTVSVREFFASILITAMRLPLRLIPPDGCRKMTLAGLSDFISFSSAGAF